MPKFGAEHVVDGLQFAEALPQPTHRLHESPSRGPARHSRPRTHEHRVRLLVNRLVSAKIDERDPNLFVFEPRMVAANAT